MDSGSHRKLRLGRRRFAANCVNMSVALLGWWMGSLLLPAYARASGTEGSEEESRVTFGLVSIVVPQDYEIVITLKQPDASIGYLQRNDGFRVDFALGMVGLDEADEPEARVVAWTLSGEGRLGQIKARLLIENDGKMRFDGSADMAKFASRFDDEADVGILLAILRSVGPPCSGCRRPVVEDVD